MRPMIKLYGSYSICNEIDEIGVGRSVEFTLDHQFLHSLPLAPTLVALLRMQGNKYQVSSIKYQV